MHFLFLLFQAYLLLPMYSHKNSIDWKIIVDIVIVFFYLCQDSRHTPWLLLQAHHGRTEATHAPAFSIVCSEVPHM